MKISNRLYYFEDGKMKLLSNVEQTFNIYNFRKPIIKWYKKNPYAKRINKEWICKDYRIDQQRPMRNVYSEAYLKITNITKIEERYISDLINELENKIKYPKVIYDDGKEYVYKENNEEVKSNKIKKRKFKDNVNSIHCHNCNSIINKNDNYCSYCGVKQIKLIKCKYCECEIKNKNYCSNCGEKL